MTFDPNKFLEQPSIASGFNPDEFLSESNNDLNSEEILKNYLQKQEQYGQLPDQLAAGAAGIARGATLGLSDLALTESGAVSPETLKGLEEANPITSGLGNVAGAGALLAGTGGASALAKGAGLAGRIGASALEGAAFSGQGLVSQYAMGNPNLNAQQIIAHLGTGALLGGGLGALGEAGSIILPKALSKTKESISKLKQLAGETTDTLNPGWSEKLALGLKYGDEGRVLKSSELESTLSEMYKSGKKAANDLYENALKENVSKSLESMPIDLAKNIAKESLDNSKNILKGMSEITGYEVRPLLSETSNRVINEILDRAESNIFKAKTAAEVQNSLAELSRKAKKLVKFDKIPTAAQEGDQAILRQFSDDIKFGLEDSSKWGKASSHYKAANDIYHDFIQSEKGFRNSFMVKDPTTNKYRISPTKVNSFFSKTGDPSQKLKEEYLEKYVSSLDNMSKASESYEGYIKGIDSISEHVQKLAKDNKELNRLAKIMKKESASGPSDTEAIAAGLVSSALGASNPLSVAITGGLKTYGQVVNPYQLGSNIGGIFEKAQAIAQILNKTTKAIEKGTKSIFEPVSKVTKVIPSIFSEKEFNKNYIKIQQLANNNQDMQNHLERSTASVFEVDPELSSSVHSTLSSGINFLNTKLPRPNNELPFNQEWKPTPSQMEKFNKYVQAVSDPISALKEIKEGSLSNETMEALQSVHPDLLKSMREMMFVNMDPKKVRNLPYSVKISLSKFMGKPLESNMLPNVMKANQQLFQTTQEMSKPSRLPKGLKDGASSTRSLPGLQQSMMRNTFK